MSDVGCGGVGLWGWGALFQTSQYTINQAHFGHVYGARIYSQSCGTEEKVQKVLQMEFIIKLVFQISGFRLAYSKNCIKTMGYLFGKNKVIPLLYI